MRLTRIKLSGFKSFVDPTTVHFPGQVVGVVGPNGCGKSNVIDAVRWVLGESKASELRGESIQDVIFKGAGTRKEVSRASVELYFDNTQGRASGQWSQYAEITIKRVLDRQGNSSYSINGLNVRRRDVIDLFLGTGLGPRAYAIIGQGMINRIIEAKPDELRLFLEEAAGVTKYKERRRDTENRLENARENIARVDDIRNELMTQMMRLSQQAEVATRYHELRAQWQMQQNLLWLKKREDARTRATKLAREAAQESERVEADTARLRALEVQVEQARQAHFAASDNLHQVQSQMQLASAEVRRIEAEIRHVEVSRQRLDARMQQLNGEQTHWQDELARVEEEEFRWRTLLENSRGRSGEARARHAVMAAQVPEMEAAVANAHEQVLSARAGVNQEEQNTRLAEAERSHALRAIESLRQRKARLEAERAGLVVPDLVRLASLESARATAQQTLDERIAAVQTLQAALPEREAHLRASREALQQAHRARAEAQARHDALQQLQARIADDGKLGAWLKSQGIANLRQIWQVIDVDPGWETAIESVLRERLSALCLDTSGTADALSALLHKLEQTPPPVALAIAFPADTTPSAPKPESLRSKVRCKDARFSAVLDEWLADMETIAEIPHTVTAAYPPHMAVTAPGHVRTAHSLSLYAPQARTHGVLERQRELEGLQTRLQTLAAAEREAQQEEHEAEAVLEAMRAQAVQARRVRDAAQQEAHQKQMEVLQLSQVKARFDERHGQIESDLAEIIQAEAREQKTLAESEAEADRCRTALQEVRTQLEHALESQRDADTQLRELRAQESQLAREAQAAEFSERECTAHLENNAHAAQTARMQNERVGRDQLSVQEELAALSDTVLHTQLQSALANRQTHETGLAQQRQALEAAVAGLKALDEDRMRLEHGLQPARDKIAEIRMRQQAEELAAEQHDARLREGGIDSTEKESDLLSAVGGTLPKETAVQTDIARLAADIEALGAVNLAAGEELTEARSRQEYLDRQAADLNEAIRTLEDAIRRIDQETRDQLAETFASVNRHFGALFPALFGGGEARLNLTGEEILDAGIQIMAQPPGKKNTTIHLLSGGEKALTAIALVFALFRLNPAPFCMLDEVDAPLDDSNTVRFCELVKNMSANTQFVFISHNKIAMEMAQQLIGVTMQERGVSRVVDVDIQEALRMAQEKEAA